MYTPTCRFRFHGDLCDFLPANQRNRWIEYALDSAPEGAVAVKHPIEALGAPHPEVELILVNGVPASFAHRLQDGDEVRVYPQGCAPVVRSPVRLRPQLERPPRFLLDTHLGRLAAYLRMLGFDAAYGNDYDDEQLATLAHGDRRVLLTRDRGLLKRKIVAHGFCVRQTRPSSQLVDIIRRYALAPEANPWSRCVRCNGLLEPVDKAEILDCLEPKTKLYYDEFQRCTACAQIYWRGSHHERMRSFLADALAEAALPAEPDYPEGVYRDAEDSGLVT